MRTSMSHSILAQQYMPRQIVPSGVGSRPPSWLWLAIIPHVWVGALLIGQVAKMSIWAAAGTNQPALNVRLSSRAGSKGGTIYELEYQWDDRGIRRSERTYLGESSWKTLQHNPSAASVRVLRFGRAEIAHDIVVNGRSPWRQPGGLLPVVLFWDGLMAAFITGLWVRPRLYRNLYKIGAVAPGWIMGKRAVKGKGITYHIDYEYNVDGQLREGKMTTDESAYNRAHSGEAVHVLYHPNGGKRSIIYEYGGYRWADDGMTARKMTA